jgi:hypothetical protein
MTAGRHSNGITRRVGTVYNQSAVPSACTKLAQELRYTVLKCRQEHLEMQAKVLHIPS